MDYSGFFVGSNGFVTFSSGRDDPISEVSAFFAQPIVAGLSSDLHCGQNSSTGEASTVTVDQYAERVVVTFDQVPHYYDDGIPLGPNSFQIILNANGVVELHYLAVSETEMTFAGIGSGLGVAPYADEIDLVPPPLQGEQGDGCEDPIVVSAFPYQQTFTLSDYSDTMADLSGTNCAEATYQTDLFFSVVVPAGQSLMASATRSTGSDQSLALEVIESCISTECVTYGAASLFIPTATISVDNTEGESDLSLIVVLQRGGITTEGSVDVTFLLLP